MKHLDTQIAHVDRQIQEQVTRSRNISQKRNEQFQNTHDEHNCFQNRETHREYTWSQRQLPIESILERYLEDERYEYVLDHVLLETNNKRQQVEQAP